MPATPASKNLTAIRHTLAHLLAHAVQDQFPQATFAIGPAIDNGFYYDVDVGRPLRPEDLPTLERRMRHLVKQGLAVEKIDAEHERVKRYLAAQPFKQELVADLHAAHQEPTYYQVGHFIDLCRGGHVTNTRDIPLDGFKLSHLAGAYWRGDSAKPMLQRIYGVAFQTKAELDQYLARQAEAAKRDHRKLGKELGIFSMHDVAPGTPFWLPAGMIIIRELESLLRTEYQRRGFVEVRTPILVKKDLWQQSGHWDHYRENMFTLRVENEDYALKAMNCPASCLIYGEQTRSYRDLPLRLAEFGVLHRNEIAGALGGLFRVRGFTQDDAHLYCRPDQITKEIGDQLRFTLAMHRLFGFKPSFRLATRPEPAMGDPKLWELAERSLASALRSNNIPYAVAEKDGAFYGPKIDIDVTDSLGRTWTIATIQLDFQMPERFALEYTDEHGRSPRPIMIHRAIFGSYERFIGLLIEHFAGAFPLWLSPTQVELLTVAKKHRATGQKLLKLLTQAGLRVHLDDSDETVGYKIRKAEKQKVPYMIVVGEKEKTLQRMAIRVRGKKQVRSVRLKTWIIQAQKKMASRSSAL